ncbi:MAG: hypothetical protein ACPLXM_07835 [Bacteroidales bacterium]
MKRLMKNTIFGSLILICTLQFSFARNDNSFKQRSDALIRTVADHYMPPSFSIEDPEKYYWPKAIARFALYGAEDSLSNAWIGFLGNRPPFHFTLVGMARLLYLFPDAPALKKNKLLILSKVFERTDSYNAFTGEGTENHISMSRTSGYLFAQAAKKYPEYFPEAIIYQNLMKDWILNTSHKYYHAGNGEWNSSIYETYNIIGWLNLFDFAEDPEVRKAARAVLDFYATCMALHYSWGAIGGAEMRGTGISLGNTNSMSYLCWLWFAPNEKVLPFGFVGSQYIQCVHAATSTYQPPQTLIKLAQKKTIFHPYFFRESKPGYLLNPVSFVKQYFYINPTFTLGSAISSYGGWTGSTAQIVPWKLVIRNDSSGIPYEIGGNGRFYDDFSGKMQQPFTQLAQYNNILIQVTLTPKNAMEITRRVKDTIEVWKNRWARDFIKRFPNDSFKHHHRPVKANERIICKNESYITFSDTLDLISKNSFWIKNFGFTWMALFPLSKDTRILTIPADGRTKHIVIINSSPMGKLCGFIIEIADTSQYKDADAFCNAIIRKSKYKQLSANSIFYRTSEGTELKFTYESMGSFMEASSDWGYGLETPSVFVDPLLLKQPQWPAGEGLGRIPSLEINGRRVDFSATWPVLEGPGISISDGILVISYPWETYCVDFSGKIPVFN